MKSLKYCRDSKYEHIWRENSWVLKLISNVHMYISYFEIAYRTNFHCENSTPFKFSYPSSNSFTMQEVNFICSLSMRVTNLIFHIFHYTIPKTLYFHQFVWLLAKQWCTLLLWIIPKEVVLTDCKFYFFWEGKTRWMGSFQKVNIEMIN